MSTSFQPGLSTGQLLLRLAPVISTTGTLVYATSELLFLSSLIHPSVTTPPATVGSCAAGSVADANVHKSVLRKVMPKYFDKIFRRGVWVVVFFNTLSWTTLAFNLQLPLTPFGSTLAGTGVSRLDARGAWWYKLSLVAVLGHLAFVPLVMGPVERLCSMAEEGRDEVTEAVKQAVTGGQSSRELVKQWLSVHRVRMCVDALAWGAAVGGFVGGLVV